MHLLLKLVNVNLRFAYLIKPFSKMSLSSIANSNQKVFLSDKYDKFTFGDLGFLSEKLKNDLLQSYKRNHLNGEKIAILCSNNYTYLISIMAIISCGAVPLGLNKSYPNTLIEYFINDSKCKLVINGLEESEKDVKTDFDTLLNYHKVINYKLMEDKFHLIKNVSKDNETNIDVVNNFKKLLNNDKDKEALILYTSGTSGPPKGVVLTCGNIANTLETLINTWHINSNDSLLHVLPLNHVHGLIYALLTLFYAGASVDMLPKFNPEICWSRLLDKNNKINTFMAVPTIYVQLVNTFLKSKELREKYPQEYIKEIFKNKIRLVVSGSAPLNVKTYKEWNEITGYEILERYGMTEIGLGLSNPYIETEESKRVAGTVGRPYGNTKVRIVEPNSSVDESKYVVVESDPENDTFSGNKDELFGELQIKGSMVFKEYLNKPLQTKETFTKDGWFKTGDTAQFLKDIKAYKLIGRTSVDVIKSGGYKISALDIEKVLLSHPLIDDVAIMGLSDPVWGQKIFSLIVLKQNVTEKDFLKHNEFKLWCKERLPKYQVPTLIRIIEKMPRNLLGKVNKKELIKYYEKEFEQTK